MPKEKPPKGRRQKAEAKPKRLRNNKTWFKFLMPKNRYLEDIRFGEVDIPFLILVMVLLVFGLIMMYSASYAWAIHKGQTPDYYFKRQLMWSGLGLLVMFIIASPIFDYHILRHPLVTFGLFGVSTLLMILVIAGVSSITDGGATRWIEIGGVSFQPSELMKLAVIMLFASLISANYRKMQTIKGGIVPYISILVFVSALMIAQPHLSGTIIICAIGVSMMFIGGVKKRHFIPLLIIGVAGLTAIAYIMYKVGNFDYISKRVVSWLYTFEPEYKDIAWQTRNSLIAIGSGGVFGLGLGNSRQKFLYLPESQNDFVFSIICEELGFIGALVVIILFLMLIFRGFSIAENAPDKYGMLLASGLIIQIGIQAFLNIAVVSNTIPNTGISLPFFSYGGTALILQLAEMGIILNISRQSIPKKEKPDSDNAEERAVQNAKNALGAKAQLNMDRTRRR